jgi:chromosome partitioning protein
MAKIITVVQLKGGATKTTTTINVAGGLIERGYKVRIIDINNEQSAAMRWAKRGTEFVAVVVASSDTELSKDIIQLSKEADWIIIDTPPELMAPALKAALLCDLMIIPCPPSPLDLEASEETVELAEAKNKPFRLLASNVRAGTNLGKKLPQTLKRLGKTFTTVIHQRISIVESAMVGQWVGSYEPNSEAHIEYKNLVDELLAIKELS